MLVTLLENVAAPVTPKVPIKLIALVDLIIFIAIVPLLLYNSKLLSSLAIPLPIYHWLVPLCWNSIPAALLATPFNNNFTFVAATALPIVTVEPLNLPVPLTSKVAPGLLVPIPTLPAVKIVLYPLLGVMSKLPFELL